MSRKKQILLIEGDENIVALIKLQAKLSKCQLLVETDGLKGYQAIKKKRPDLVILDLMLPRKHGLDICRKIKGHPELRSIPVIILSTKNQDLDVTLGLELGADDYVTKPFSPKILFSRVKAVMRNQGQWTEKKRGIVTFGPFVFDLGRYQLRKHDQYISLALGEYGVLRALVSKRGKVLTRSQILEEALNHEFPVVKGLLRNSSLRANSSLPSSP